MNNAEEATKSSRETKWATLGRAIADSSRMGESPAAFIDEAAALRQMEQERTDKASRFAGLARQVGDAARNGADLAPLLLLLRDLRTAEIG